MTPQVSCSEAPLPADLRSELISFWEETFGTDYDFHGLLAGEERGINCQLTYVRRMGDELMGTACLVYAERQAGQPDGPIIGGFGEVATAPAHRRQGTAAQLCALARDEFAHRGGAAVFLGTGNPDAARIYHRLGFRKLASTNVMAQVNAADSPESFLESHFAAGASVEICAGSVRARCHMIPLMVCPHDCKVLDANAGVLSTRYAVQSSCMGLFPRFQRVAEVGGTWFEAWTGDGRLVGMATARRMERGVHLIDGFTHGRYAAAWEELMAAALQWSAERGAERCRADVCVEDEDKRARFRSLGFRTGGEGDGFEIAGRSVASRRLEKAL